jgi:3-oxoacyl-[acyl-carrier protein] reductase
VTGVTKLDGKIALVTGGSRGIGRGIALALARAGAGVVVNYLAAEDQAAEVVAMIGALGRRARAIRADVSTRDDVRKMVDEASAFFGGIDILINNAGIAGSASTLDLSEAAWDRVLAVNLKGTFLCAQAVTPVMITRRYGRIVNISSIAGQTGGAIGPHYAASKAGILGLTRFMARELAPHGITVNAIAPAGIPTDLLTAMGRAGESLSARPVGRAGTPEDVAAAAVFLASDASGYITGQTLSVNGGSWMA